MSWPGQASEHDADHGEADEGGDGACVAFEVAGEAPIATDPGQGSLDDPSLGQDNEFVQLVALDDLHDPTATRRGDARHARPLISCIGKDALDEREEAARAMIENKRRAVAVLHIGRVNDDIQQEAEGVDQNMPLAARDLLARIEALRVKRKAPF